MPDGASREMSLDEFLDTLPPSHRARQEYEELRAKVGGEAARANELAARLHGAADRIDEVSQFVMERGGRMRTLEGLLREVETYPHQRGFGDGDIGCEAAIPKDWHDRRDAALAGVETDG